MSPKGGEYLNANSVWVGHEYAYVDIIRRGVIPMGALRVKVLSKREVFQYGKTRKDTIAKVTYPDGQRMDREVNVRNLYDFWDSYVDERDAARHRRELAQAERERVWAEQDAERQRLAAIRQKDLIAKQQKLERIKQGLAAMLSIDPSVIQTDGTNEWLKVNVKDLAFLETYA